MSFAAERQAREERQNAFEGTKPLLEKLNRGERLTVEERSDLSARHARIGELNAEIRDYETARELSAASTPSVPESRGGDVDVAEVRAQAFTEWLRSGERTPELRAGLDAETVKELRAAGVGTGAGGGFTVPPGWWQNLQVATKAYGGTANDFEQLETESGQPMQWSTVDPTTVVATLIGENTQVSDVDYVFGQGNLGAYMFTSGAHKVSYQLANDSAFDIDAFITARVGESQGRAQAQYAISGTGSNQPLGIVTALNAATGLTSGGLVTLTAATSVQTLGGTSASPATTTELAGNVLSFQTVLKLIKSIDPTYRELGAKWYMNDTQSINEMAVTDFYGHPIWQPSPQVGRPDMLYNFPVQIDNNIPNLTASTSGGPIFGHLKSAMVKRTVNQSGILRLSERYADFFQVGFIGYMRWDIRSNDLRAAVTVKPAAT